jgi:hypothetical protein
MMDVLHLDHLEMAKLQEKELRGYASQLFLG